MVTARLGRNHNPTGPIIGRTVLRAIATGVSVTGPGSDWQVSGQLIVGNGAAG